MNQSIEALDTFCGTPFWNASLTWNTTNPDFTICFEKTALVFIPVGFFWTFLPLEIIFLKRSQYRDIGRNWRYLLKRLILFVLVLICICDFFSNAPANIPLQKVNIFMPIVKLITFATCGVLAHKNTRNGYRGSGHQFLFWLLCTICGIPQFRSELQRVSGEFISENVFSDITYLLYFPLVCCMLILNSISEGVPRIMLKKQKESPIKEYGFLGKLLYIAYGSILYKGFRKPLEFEDTWYLDYENRAENIVPLFENEFKRRQEYNTKKNSEFSKKRHAKNANIVSALSVLFACFYPAFLIGILCRLVGEFILFINPQILRLLISFIGSDEPMWKGYLYAISMFIFGSTHTLINNTHMYNLWLFSIRSQTAIRSAIYRKALRISNATKKDKTVGEIVNIMAVDANRFQDFSLHVPALLSAPLQLALSLYFLWQEVGPSILAGFAVMILLIPLNVFIVRQSKKLQVKQMKDKDERVKMMNEVLNGIKVLKLYAWEPSFERIVEKIRVKEIKTILLMNYLNAVAQFVWNMAPFLVSFVTFATYVLIDENNVLDAPKVFVSLSLLNILRAPLNQIPTVMSTLVQTAVALKRINAFLNADELDPYIEHDRTEGIDLIYHSRP